MASPELEDLKRRRDKAWGDKSVWNSIYQEAWRYAVPYRRPVNGQYAQDPGTSRMDHLYDTTAVMSAFRGSGKMQQDLFPPGVPFFRLKPGPVVKLVHKAQQKAKKAGKGHNGGPPLDGGDASDDDTRDYAWFERQLDDMSEQVQPFFLTGEFDNAMSEACIDLFVGTGVMLMIEGTKKRPIRFVTLPVDECAFESGPYGDVGALFWRTKMTPRVILKNWPKGKYPQEFLENSKEGKSPDVEIDLNQDFVQVGEDRWEMIVTITGSDEPIVRQKYKTQPFFAARYFRVPGETHGRGPVLLSIPSIKTLNRAFELSLKNYALSMLGIWGYRPGGTFNPDTVSKAPGAFWPMQATGGVMGPDVFRMDTGGGKADLSQIVVDDLRRQIQAFLNDVQLPDGAATPKSATEIMARVAQIKQHYVGAYGRMIHEIIPVVVRRSMEILYKFGLITTDMSIDSLLVSIQVISPLAQALKADAWQTTVQVMQIIAQSLGPQAVSRFFNLDTMIPEMIKDLGIDSEFVRTAKELADYDQQQAQQAKQAQVDQAIAENPQGVAQAAQTAQQMMQGGQPGAAGAGAPQQPAAA